MRSIKLSLKKKLLFSALTTLAFLAALEVILALCGVRPEAEQSDRSAGFSGFAPLMVSSVNQAGETILSTAENKRHWFNYQAFPRHKSKGTLRIFCMGGSTTYGHPYWDETSFAGWLRNCLPVIDDKQNWEVINAGGISYASYRVAALMEELAQYEPDYFIVYSAHNEFLERRTYSQMFAQPSMAHHATAVLARTRIWTVADRVVQSFRNAPSEQARDPAGGSTDSLSSEVDEELNHTVGPVDYHRDDLWRQQVVKSYCANLQKMIDVAKRSGARIIFVMPAANEKDCSPFKSESSVSEQSTLEQVKLLTARGDQALEQGNYAEAVPILEQATKLDVRNANLHYQLGRAFLGQSDFERAGGEFRRAIDEDVCPLRAVSELEQSLREVAKSNAVPLVDFQGRLRQWTRRQTGNSLFGGDQFLDHVHPTIEVNWQMALWIIDELQQRGLFQGRAIGHADLQEPLDNIRQRVLAAIDQEDEIFAMRNLAKVLHWAGKFEEAIPRARDTLELAPNDPESRFIVASCLANLGKTEQAIDEYELLFADGIGFPRAYLPYGELLAAQGQWEQAKAYLLFAILRNPTNPAAFYSLSKVHQALGEEKFAAEALATAEQLTKTADKKFADKANVNK